MFVFHFSGQTSADNLELRLPLFLVMWDNDKVNGSNNDLFHERDQAYKKINMLKQFFDKDRFFVVHRELNNSQEQIVNSLFKVISLNKQDLENIQYGIEIKTYYVASYEARNFSGLF